MDISLSGSGMLSDEKKIIKEKESLSHRFHCRDQPFFLAFKGLLHCFSTCIEITGNNRYYFILKNVENCKEKFQRLKKL